MRCCTKLNKSILIPSVSKEINQSMRYLKFSLQLNSYFWLIPKYPSSLNFPTGSSPKQGSVTLRGRANTDGHNAGRTSLIVESGAQQKRYRQIKQTCVIFGNTEEGKSKQNVSTVFRSHIYKYNM